MRQHQPHSIGVNGMAELIVGIAKKRAAQDPHHFQLRGFYALREHITIRAAELLGQQGFDVLREKVICQEVRNQPDRISV